MARMRPLQQVGKAGQAVQNTAAQANRTLADVRELIGELQDGVTLRFVRVGPNSIMDFVTGRCDELPIGVRVDVREDKPA